MNISITDNTIRFEDENGSHAWPLYMDAPVDHPLITALNIQQSPVTARFDDSTCTITAGNDTITPDTDLSGYPEEVRVFAETIYSFDPNPEGEGRYAEMWRLMSMEDEPDEPLTTTENVYAEDGVTVIDQKQVPVMETVIEPVDVKVKGKWIRQPRPVERQKVKKVKKGKKVPESAKQRLQALKSLRSLQEPL